MENNDSLIKKIINENKLLKQKVVDLEANILEYKVHISKLQTTQNPSNELNSPRILIVDDHIYIRKTYGLILKKEGFNIAEAKSGAKAIEMLSQNSSFDLIILDINMPEMDGLETCKAIRANEHTSQIPIIFLTGDSDKKTVKDAILAGGNSFIIKGHKKDELMLKISKFL